MRSSVSVELVAVRESLIALLAHVGLLPSVNPHVLVETGGASKAGLAVFAPVWLLTGVSQRVTAQVALLVESGIANITRKHFIFCRRGGARVHLLAMSVEGRFIGECQPTLGADMNLLVLGLVLGEVLWRSKCSTALGTAEEFWMSVLHVDP